MQTARGTVGGDLLRRYWQPIAAQAQLSAATPILAVRVLSEGLALFRDTRGEVGLVQERCPHNGYPLTQGHVESDALVCYRHGWHFNGAGDCWVVGYQDKIYPVQWANATAYPVCAYAGLYWAYLGPQPVPAPPQYAPLEPADGHRRFTIHPALQCNWMDLAIDQMRQGESLLLPTHTESNVVHLRLPMDDTHTWEVVVELIAGDAASDRSAEDAIVVTSAEDCAGLLPSDVTGPEAVALREQLERELERAPMG